jgi:hypothetical protein
LALAASGRRFHVETPDVRTLLASQQCHPARENLRARRFDFGGWLIPVPASTQDERPEEQDNQQPKDTDIEIASGGIEPTDKVFVRKLRRLELVAGDEETFDARAVEGEEPERTEKPDGNRLGVLFHKALLEVPLLPPPNAHANRADAAGKQSLQKPTSHNSDGEKTSARPTTRRPLRFPSVVRPGFRRNRRGWMA